MSRFDQVSNIPVPIGPCECPGTPHGDGDVVYLAPRLSAPGGMAAQGAIVDGGTDSLRLQELLWRVYRDHGILDWNLLDEDGEPVPLTAANKEAALPYGKGGEQVADKADDLYSEDVLRPFLARLAVLEATAKKEKDRARRSAAGSTASSPAATSAAPTSITKRRRRSSTRDTAGAPPAA